MTEPMAAADVAWLRMERPTNPMTITGVMTTATPMDRAALRRLVGERLLPYRRFRQRVEGPGGLRPRWADAADFDVERHLIPHTLPEPGDQAALEASVSALMSAPMSFAHPPWTIHHVERYGEGSALIVRLHHCIADGIALMHVLLSIADEQFDPAHFPGKRPRRPLGARIAKTLKGAAAETADLLTQPRHLAARVTQGGRGAGALVSLLAMRPDSETLFKGPATPAKRAAWTRPIPLDDVKAVARAAGAKVNDVLLAAATGALRRYLQDEGEPVAGVDVRAAVPFNVRPLERAYELGNRFALVFLSLPVGEATLRGRLAELKKRMDAIKGSAEPAVVYGILQSIGRAPAWAHRLVVKMFSEKTSAVMTNVPGPAEPLHLLGHRIDGLMFWVPQAGDIGLGVSILSFGGRVLVGVATDGGRVPEPARIAAAVEEELDAMCAEAGER